MTIVLDLPWPPTGNNLYPADNYGVRHRSAEYKAYRKEVWVCVLQQLKRAPRLSSRLCVTYGCNVPDRRRRDLSNLLKALEDSLTFAGVWGDDYQIDEIHMLRDSPLAHGRIHVEIRELPISNEK